MTRSCADQRGFALLIVLWTLALLALIGTQMLAAARQDTELARNLLDSAKLEAAADGAVQRAIFGLLDSSNAHWNADGATRIVHIGQVHVAVRIASEADKANPNFASTQLLQALLAQVGANPVTAATVATAIAEWRGAGDSPRWFNATTTRYIAAGRAYAPSGEPFTSLDELAAVLGMTPDLLALLRPHLTVFTDGDPSSTTHDVVVAQALVAAGEHGADADMDAASEAVCVSVDAAGARQARYAAQVVVQTNGRTTGKHYDILAYHRLRGS
jgi:general secretion pathway protein K